MKKQRKYWQRHFTLSYLLSFLFLFGLVVLLLSFSSCSANWHVKRAIKKDPTIIQKDTVFVKDTLYLPEIKHDTAFIEKNEVDTFIIEKERLKVKIIKDYDTLKVSGECKEDTIFYEKEIPVEKIIYKEKKKKCNWIAWFFAGALSVLLLRSILLKAT